MEVQDYLNFSYEAPQHNMYQSNLGSNPIGHTIGESSKTKSLWTIGSLWAISHYFGVKLVHTINSNINYEYTKSKVCY